MGIYGKTFKINRYDTQYNPMGGTILNATLDPRIQTHMEAGTAQRQLASHKVVAAKPVLDFEMNIRRLTDFITSHAMITAEGVVPAHTLYYTDGTESYKFENSKVNTCRISIKTLESVKANIQVALKSHAALSPSTFEFRTEDAMYKDAVTTLNIESAPVTGWSEIEFGVDNKVLQEVLGTDIEPTEVEEQEAVYTGHILRAKPSTSKYTTALDGTVQDIVIALQDNQSSPVTKTFTYANACLKTSKIEIRKLGLDFERIEWEGKSQVIS